jgi:hypothetical protein
MSTTPTTDPAAPSRVLFIRSPRRLSEDELRMALAGLTEDDPRWLAFNQVLDEELAAAVLDSSAPDLDPTKGTYPGGRVAALAELKNRLAKLRSSPIRQTAPAATSPAKARRTRR